MQGDLIVKANSGDFSVADGVVDGAAEIVSAQHAFEWLAVLSPHSMNRLILGAADWAYTFDAWHSLIAVS